MNYPPLLIIFVGLLAGLHSACWGLYKDSPYEKGNLTKFIRSLVMGIIIALLLDYLLIKTEINAINLGIFFAVCVVFERFITEIYKGFFRIEPQKKYKIPSLFHLGRYIIRSILLKESVGAGLLILTISLFLFFAKIPFEVFGIPHIVLGGFFGLLLGVFEAMGGAEKDAPFEGFEPLKVFRSPLVDLIWGIALSFFTMNYGLLFLATGGAGRMAIEFYKTFIIKKVPGKFKAKTPPYPIWIKKRNIVVLPYVLTWISFILLLILR
jgi:hypothetical protein